ncbi:MAG TPA: glycosyltransferase family A protein [Candidatus Acidoferrales bacterium]|nr:glycosyltransferase family A protein [Candidatus Acidoferrales bacterium]
MRPLVTVLLDTYNQERYIEQALLSVLEQDFPAHEMEILVVDDGSTDGTPEVVRKFAPRVRLLRKENGGQASAFNAGFAESTGQIVSFLDGDDWFAPGKLTLVTNALEREPHASGIGHGYYEFSQNSNATRICAPSEARFLTLSTPEAARDAFTGWMSLLTSSFTVRKKTLDRIFPLSERLFFCADAPIALGSMVEGARLLNEPLCYYRVHSENLHAIQTQQPLKIRRKLEIEEVMFQELESVLIRLGAPRESVAALLYPPWTATRRAKLSTFGGSRLDTLRTEMRLFHLESKRPGAGYLLFKYLVMAPTTLLLPPRSFYKAREWYGRRNLGRIRERVFGTGKDTRQDRINVQEHPR